MNTGSGAVADGIADRLWAVGWWWNVEVGGHAVPVWGKSYVPDELMLLFTDGDRFVDSAKVEAFAESENWTVDGPEAGSRVVSWQSGRMGYQATAGKRRLNDQDALVSAAVIAAAPHGSGTFLSS